MLDAKQPSPITANAKDGSKQAKPFSSQPSKRKTNYITAYRTRSN
jgi:hypothetical protein